MIFTRRSIPRSIAGFTYVFTPRDILRSLFSSFEMDFPTVLEDPINITTVLQPNDIFPSGLNADDIALAGRLITLWVANGY
jgi:hypothetical protein